MIIGRGDIASVIVDDPGFLFFASGVSKSACTEQKEFRRERDLLLRYKQTVKADTLHVVYFSSFSAYNEKPTPYNEHKYDMERLIESTFRHYTIARIGNITWGKNPHTLLNHLRHCIHDGYFYEVKNVYRFIVTENEFRDSVSYIKTVRPRELSIYGERVKVTEIVERIKGGLL